MIKLSDRLQIIADRVEKNKTMADIGTDHGFLPIYLIQSGKCKKVIATDISMLSLSKAIENAERILKDNKVFEARKGNGLNVLDDGEADTVVIAGMGGKLIRDIMAADLKHTCSFNRFVLQPRIGQGVLRKWLCENGFRIINEDVVHEGSYIPEIITVLSPSKRKHRHISCLNEAFIGASAAGNCNGEDIRFKVPAWIINAGGPIEEFLRKNIEQEKNILKNVMLAKKRNVESEKKICNNIYYLKKLLKEVEYGKK